MLLGFIRRILARPNAMPPTTPPPPIAPAITPLDVARRYIGKREASRNQAPWLLPMWQDTSYGIGGHTNREPWCATFICYCLHQARREGWQPASSFLPKEAAVRFFLSASRNRPGIEVFAPNAKPLLPGDIIVFLPRLSHIGILEKIKGSTLHTIEGNTNSAGSREGDGVYGKTRNRSFPSHIIRFLAQ